MKQLIKDLSEYDAFWGVIFAFIFVLFILAFAGMKQYETIKHIDAGHCRKAEVNTTMGEWQPCAK